MKPRTAAQKEVAMLYSQMGYGITDAQRNWIETRMREETMRTYNETGKSVFGYVEYFDVITTYKGWQVVLHVASSADYLKTKGFRFNWWDIPAVHWLKGTEVVYYQSQKQMCWYSLKYPYCRSVVPSMRQLSWRCDRFRNIEENVYPVRKYLPQFKGMRNMLWEVDLTELAMTMNTGGEQTKAHLETILKYDNSSAYRGLISKLMDDAYESSYRRPQVSRINKHWHAIKIARRNGYIPGDWGDWFDLLDMLELAHLDTHSPKYICPQDFDEMHERLMMLTGAMERPNADHYAPSKEDIKNAKDYESTYNQRMTKWTEFTYSKGDIILSPLTDIDSVIREANYMHHCVLRCEYYKKENSLLLSAHNAKGKRMETIELDLRKFEILQSRGRKNKSTQWHDEIVSMCKESLPQIRKIANYKANAMAIA